MSVMRALIETAARYMPDGTSKDPLSEREGYVGKPLDRVDGQLKVTGRARFTAEYHLEDMAYAVPVHSAIAKGKVARLYVGEAERAPGVIAVITPDNMPKLNAPQLADGTDPKKMAASEIAVLQDNIVSWNGQAIAMVVAETLEQAEHAASLVRAEYDAEQPTVSFQGNKARAITPKDILGEPPEVRIGDAEKNLSAAAVRVDQIYNAPYYNHNAIEPHATVAFWEDDRTLNVFDSTQAVIGYQSSLAHVCRLKPDDVRVVAPFVGGGFGGKAGLWANTALTAAASKVLKRPVCMALSREAVFRLVGGRTISE